MSDQRDLFAELGAVLAPAPARPCGECCNIKPTKFRRYLGVGFFCTESLNDARREDSACDTHFALRTGPCDSCGDVCDVYPCANADPKGP